MTGRIEIKDKVWKSGEYAFEACGSCATPIEDFGLISFFAFAGGMQSPLQLTSVNNAIPCKENSRQMIAFPSSGSIRMNSSWSAHRLG